MAVRGPPVVMFAHLVRGKALADNAAQLYITPNQLYYILRLKEARIQKNTNIVTRVDTKA